MARATFFEIGFFRGKSSAYIGAILEDQGAGKLTTIDRLTAARLTEPNIHTLIGELGLSHRVEPIFAHRSFTWELSRLMRMDPMPRFDLCYFDGGHTWDDTGFGFTLVNYLLKPGGVIVFDDIDWTISGSKAYRRDSELMARFSEDERACQSVRLVWDILVPRMGYTRIEEIPLAGWAVAQKPEGAEPVLPPAPVPIRADRPGGRAPRAAPSLTDDRRMSVSVKTCPWPGDIRGAGPSGGGPPLRPPCCARGRRGRGRRRRSRRPGRPPAPAPRCSIPGSSGWNARPSSGPHSAAGP